jgi:hypothetical protein
MIRFLLPYGLLVFLTILAALTLSIISPLYFSSHENGLIEQSTSYLLCLAAILALYFFTKTKQNLLGISSALFLFGSMREMDWHSKFTSQSVLKSRFYLDSNTPGIEKIIGIFVIFLLIYIIIKFFKELYSFRKNLNDYSTALIILILGISLFIIGKFLDGIFRYIPELIIYRDNYSDSVRNIEEILECMGAIALAIFPYIFWRNDKKFMAVPRLNLNRTF